MTTSLDLAITAIRSGRQEEGRQLLNLLIQKNPNNEMAWLWMSSVVDNDEQRARCLYHVLAIDPGNVVARHGLRVLGIVVSDSRPVKVPRDSQPIKIPKPTDEERRPFRLDPQAIADELPFTPVKAPFTSPGSPPSSTGPSDSQPPEASPPPPAQKPQPQPHAGPLPPSSKPVWVKRAKVAPQKAPPPKRQTGSPSQPAEPVPVTPVNTNPTRRPHLQAEAQSEPHNRPAEPVKINIAPKIAPRRQPQRVSRNPGPAEPEQSQNRPQAASQPRPTAAPAPSGPDQGETQKLPNAPDPSQAQPPANPTGGGSSSQPQGASPPAPAQPASSSRPGPGSMAPHSQAVNGSEAQQWSPQPPLADTGPLGSAPPSPQPSPPETRPTQPMPHANQTMNMPVYPGNEGRQSFGPPAFQANMIPGMPPQQPPPYYSQAMAAMQPHPMMGMPLNGQPFPAPQPVPPMHSNPTMGMPAPSYLQFQSQPPPNSAVHSNSTMAMPSPQANPVDYRLPRAAPAANRSPNQEAEKEEGVNILAVIIFGSLSVTALGGLGMLILLMATAN